MHTHSLRITAVVLFVFAAVSVFGQQHFFWDNPVPLLDASGSFPQSARGSDFAVIGWQEAVELGNNTGQIYISVAIGADGQKEKNTALEMWDIRNRVAGPYPYALGEPSIFNIAIDKKNRIIICIASETDKIDLLISSDKGKTFTRTQIVNRAGNAATYAAVQDIDLVTDEDKADLLAPKIFCMANGSYTMWAVRNIRNNLTLFYSYSDDCLIWSNFQLFDSSAELTLNFLPSHLSLKGRDYVVFQSFIPGSINRPSFQLYIKSSGDGGRTWSSANRVTRWIERFEQNNIVADVFNNERVHLSADVENGVETGDIFMVWERRRASGIPSVYGCTIDTQGELKGELMRINGSSGACNNPISFMFKEERIVFWFDNRRGEDEAYMAQSTKTNGDWSNWFNTTLSRFSETAIYTRSLIVDGSLFIFWQEITNGKSQIVLLASDVTASAPTPRGENFLDGEPVSSSVARIIWDEPYDSSGIQGYSWIWGRDANALPPKIIGAGSRTSSVEEVASVDGQWYFTIIACDKAGNWSPPRHITFVRDTTPPPAAQIIPLGEDENGYIYSNTFTMRWNQPPASDLAGYSWRLDYLGSTSENDNIINASFKNLQSAYDNNNTKPFALRVMGDKNESFYDNQDNGTWCFTVFPIDAVGNVGPSSTYIFKMNKYQPHTYITFIESSQDIQGNLKMFIVGRGFSNGGDVTNIYFRRGGAKENVHVLSLGNGDYTVLSDREIVVPFVENLPAGKYYIHVDHPLRGIAAGSAPIDIRRSLTVKFGDYTKFWDAKWVEHLKSFFVFDFSSLILLLLMIFCVVMAVLSIRGIGGVFAETKAAEIEILALLNGELMPTERKRLKKVIRRRGIGLRIKIASFAIVLVSFVVAMVSVPLYRQMSRTQKETLMRGLWDRSVVLIEGITASARVYMPSNSVLELGYLPRQSSSVPEASYITITGYGSGTTASSDYVWASNDADILKKINTSVLQAGTSRLSDSLSATLQEAQVAWNKTAMDAIGAMAQSISEYNREGATLILQDDEASRNKLADIQTTVRALEARISSILDELSGDVQSYPPFDINDYEKKRNTSYILYKPILFMQAANDTYVRGTVRLEISTEPIIKAMAEGRQQIFTIIMYIALAALAIGGIGAMGLATVIILPIDRLVRHVEKIRDTEDKATLDGEDIIVKSKDEIALLANTINEMTHGLVKAAMASQDLSIGKEIQKKFIPLEVDTTGNKLSHGFTDTKNVQFFGYYEGAKGVSGDYFNYQNIDGRYFAIIKCDVAGKGIPAALIMIQVATMFINYFKDWKAPKKGTQIEKLVYQINEFIEALAFKGRFAAFSLCLFDSETGKVSFCNAGDNLVHWFDRSEGIIKSLTLPETPATGVLPNMLIEMRGGYKTQTITIDHGDILLLYTDGIEEAKRLFRDNAYNNIVCSEGDAPNDTPHDTHVVGQDGEELGAPRVEAIINSVMNKKKYSLGKYHSPVGENEYHFDFANCDGTVEELIMAMVSVEKVFRMYKPSGAGDESKVLVDAKIDSFLQKHFVEYKTLMPNSVPSAANPAYLNYLGVKEDDQYDDLTILGVCRK
ncbi:MAG: SpoIIE family protein phosphatase [Termitinemataceae bacterium]|nr:MAG: SpoIIE family protein phosphatase [Termitinemataceae bacterium]